MNSPTETLNTLRHHQLIGVMQPSHYQQTAIIAESALTGGLSALALAADSPDCLKLIRTLNNSPQAPVLGLTSIFEPQMIRRAAEAGAKFVMFSFTHPALIQTAHAAGILSIAGAFTPSEVVIANQAGADGVLLFPISGGGGSIHFRQIREALPQGLSSSILGVMGDITEHDLPTYHQEGAALIAFNLVPSTSINQQSPPPSSSFVIERVAAYKHALTSHLPNDRLLIRTHAGERTLDHDLLSHTAASEHLPLSVVIPGRSGTGVYLRSLLHELSAKEDAHFRVISQDGQSRVFRAHQFIHSAVIQFDHTALNNGPFRLFIADGDDRCDNLKHVRIIEEL
ncbi:MAG: hypothetical protein KTR25_01965 [Myxococcales bacterium]|nr:hypothetical protein [Myxococcales bacterium]